MLQQQWQRNLGIRVNLAVHEFSLHWKMIFEGDYRCAADYAFLMTHFDPNPYLDPFVTPGVGNPTGWTDPFYAPCSRMQIAHWTHKGVWPSYQIAKGICFWQCRWSLC